MLNTTSYHSFYLANVMSPRSHGRSRFHSVMTVLVALVLSLGAGSLHVAWAQGDEAPSNIFLVSYIRSQTTVPFFDTVVSLTNVHEQNCMVSILWKSSNGADTCVTESLIPINQTHHHCSSQNPSAASVTLGCQAVCNASTNSFEGYAIIQATATCGVRMAVDVRVYSVTFNRSVDGRITSTANIGFHDVEVYRFDGVNVAD